MKSKRVIIQKSKHKRKKKNVVRELVLGEVSFVDKGDNPGAHVLLMKSKTTTEELIKSLPNFIQDWINDSAYDVNKAGAAEFLTILKSIDASTFAEIENEKDIRNGVYDRVWTLERSIVSILDDDDVADKNEMVRQSVTEFLQSIMELTKKQGGVQMDELKKLLAALKKANPDMSDAELMKKAAKQLVKDKETLSKTNEELTAQKDEAVTKAQDLEKKVQDLEKKDPNKEVIDKSQLPEAVVKQLESQEEALKKQAEDIAKMREKSRAIEFAKRASKIETVGKTEEIADLLKNIDEHDPELATNVEKVLANAHTLIKSSPMFKEIGAGGSNDGSTAIEKLNALAKELQKADGSITFEKAFSNVYNNSANAELVKQYREERN